MKLDFFIDRPVFSTVLSTVIVIVGIVGLVLLPVDQYPQIVPPVVKVSASYPGANAQTVTQAVATPIEQELNGTPGMIYMESSSSNSGSFSATVTFDISTDPDLAAVDIQNRLKQAESRLPAEVVQNGISVEKQASSKLMTITLLSSDPKFDEIYLSNYATLNVLDMLRRIPGVGSVSNVGSRYYAMQIWVQPDKLANLGLTVSDLQAALKDQNRESAAGVLGQAPMEGVDITIPITAQGRLSSVSQFEEIVIRANPDGSIIRLRDVARISLEASSYNTESGINGGNAAVLNINMLPGANAMQVAESVRETMEEISLSFPEGISYNIPFDMTTYISESIHHVYRTLFEALLLVILVVYLSLQSWRATIIPVVAVPISLIGTFGVMMLFGFSLNMLTLLGLILAIGIVVDDAIVVVENVERNIEEGLAPLAAAHQAMREVSGPIIAIALVLCAVFVPMAFLSGVTGQFYKQFAVTIAISTVISAINSLTLSPALAALLLKPHGAKKDLPTRLIDRLFGWIFRPFNRFFLRSSNGYQGLVSKTLGRRGAVFAVYLLLLCAAGVMFKVVPGGFIPTQDKLYLIGGVKMPEGSSLARTDAVIRKMSEIGMNTEGVDYAVAFPGLNALQFTNTPNTGTVFFGLKPFDQRKHTAAEINAEINAKIAQIQQGFGFSILPPPILGLGQGSGYSLYIQDRGGLGYGALQSAVNAMSGAIMQTPGMHFPISTYQANVPQLDVQVDRDKAKAQGVSLTELFGTLQTYLGSSYVNDFNQFGRTWRVMAQADGPYRESVEDIANLRTRNNQGEMVPIGSMVNISTTYGPDPVIRYNGYPAADLIGDADPRVLSSSQAMTHLEELSKQILPNGMNIEWTDLSFQQATQGNTALIVFPVAVLLAFLVLAALYESWTLPLAVILIVPMTMLSALFGVWLTGGDNNVFVQVGLVVLMGLACKNAILIVEFARELEIQGKGIMEAALEACRLRLRPIVMTSIAFIAGTIPLILGHGAGAEVRGVTGITVFSGMLGVTLFGLFLTPVFYVTLRKLVTRRKPVQEDLPA